MPLQKNMISKINSVGGQDYMIKCLEKISRKLPPKESETINGLIIYINSVYAFPVDVLADVKEFKNLAKKHLALYTKILNKNECCEGLDVIVDIINHNIAYSEKNL